MRIHRSWIHQFTVILSEHSKHVFFIIWNRWVRLGVDWVNLLLLFVRLIWRYAHFFSFWQIMSDDSRVLELQKAIVFFWTDFSFKVVSCIFGAACYCLGVILTIFLLYLGNIRAQCVNLLTLILWFIPLIVVEPCLGMRSCFFTYFW